MSDKQQYLRLGLFVMISLVLLFCVLFFLGARSLFQPSLTIETYFNDSIAGLDVGAPVKFRGVPIGKVTAILLAPDIYERDVPVGKRKGYIVVRATAVGPRTHVWSEDLESYIARGLRIQTQLTGITGQQSLALDFFDPAKYPPLPFDWKPKYPYIPSAPSLASEIIASVQNLVSSLDKADIQRIAHNLDALLVSANKKLEELPVGQLSAEASAVLKDARTTIDRIDRVLARAPIDETVRNLSAASRRLDDLLGDPALKRTLTDVSIVTDRLRRIADSGELDRVVRNLDRTVQRADALLGDNQYDIRGIVRDLRTTSDNLRTLSEIIKRYPPGLLVGGPPPKVELPKESR